MSGGLQERLARPGLARLWTELIRRWESSDRPVSAVTLRNLSGPERQAIADLLGADRLPASKCSVTIRRVETSLGVSPDELRAALRDLRGPWANRAAERDARARERDSLWAWVVAEARRLGVDAWGDRLRARGVVGGNAMSFRSRLGRAFAVLDRLPASQIPLAGFACDVLGDPHALDHGTWLGGVVLDAVAERHDLPLPTSAEEARRLWSLAGVTADGISSSVLCLGFAPCSNDPLAQFLRSSATVAEPVAVTMSQLQRWPVGEVAPIVYAFENPSILAQAARDGWEGPPLICTSGWPNVAVITLVRQLSGCGARIRYHGDFDGKGLCIVRMLAERLDVEPWRMGVADYKAEVGLACVALQGEVPDTPWDCDLAPAMRSLRLAVFEEDVRGALLDEVRRSTVDPRRPH